jgi:hypothetical protein
MLFGMLANPTAPQWIVDKEAPKMSKDSEQLIQPAKKFEL